MYGVPPTRLSESIGAAVVWSGSAEPEPVVNLLVCRVRLTATVDGILAEKVAVVEFCQWWWYGVVA